MEPSLKRLVISLFPNKLLLRKNHLTQIYKICSKKAFSVNNTTKTEVITKEWLKMVKETVTVYSTIEMEVIMKVNGKAIKWMGSEDYIMSQVILLIKVNGSTINFMEEVKYSTTILISFYSPLNIKILKTRTFIGNIMKVFLWTCRWSILRYKGRPWKAYLI